MEKFRKELLDLINSKSTQLPPEAVYYIFKDVFRDLSDTYNQYLQQQEKIKETKEQKEEE